MLKRKQRSKWLWGMAVVCGFIFVSGWLGAILPWGTYRNPGSPAGLYWRFDLVGNVRLMTPNGDVGFGNRFREKGQWTMTFENLGLRSKWTLEPSLTELRMVRSEPSPATNLVKRVLFTPKS